MRTLLTGFVALLASAVLLPMTASADRLISIGRCPSCLAPIYGQSVVAGYDRCGRAIFNTVAIPHNCRQRHHRDCQSGGYGYGGGYGGYGYSDYGYSGYGYNRYGSHDYGYRGGCNSRPRSSFSITITR